MDLMQALEKLKQSDEFNELRENIYFSYAMIMLENDKSGSWQLGFYHKSTDKMITFILDKDEIKIEKEEEIFKKPETEVKEVEIEKVKIPYKEILKKAEEFKKKQYPKELISKTIAILQNLKELGTIWNITYVTLTFNTLNMKINAENGNIINHHLESLMNFAKE